MTFRTEARARMYRATVVTAVLAIAPMCVVMVAMTTRSWWEAVVAVAGISIGFLVLYDWRPQRMTAIAVAALAFSYAIWLVVSVVGLNPLGFLGFALLGAVLIPRVGQRQILLVVAAGLVVAATGALRFVSAPFDTGTLVDMVVMPGGLTVFIAAVILMLERHREILRDLERASELEADLGLLRERMRFASDLHDIQGHTLHVVNLKVALAEELLEADPERVRAELTEVYDEVESTIRRTKELAYGQRRLNLSAEVENARNLLEAAGVRVRIRRDGDESGGPDDLLGQVLREATTNILRHADATHVEVRLGTGGITIVNDGARSSGPVSLRGLAMLRDRVADAGGALIASRDGEHFVTSAEFGGAP